MIGRILLAALFALSAAAAPAAAPPTPLFASDEPIRLTLRGPISAVAGGSRQPRDGVMSLAGAAPETLPVRLSARGLTRLKRDVCQFAPIRVELVQPPPATSLFHGQRRLKLVTHCRASPAFLQHVLLEYAAYKLYNALTPASYRVRLAEIDYVGESGRPVTTRLGFFIEDIDDVARRNGMRSPNVGPRVATSQLSPVDAARVALFEYMIGNLDWSTRAGPAGDECCHNSRLIAPASGAAQFLPVPYDFDYSGLVDAPYAVPPDTVNVRSVRTRYYRGYCAHNPQAAALARELRDERPRLAAVLGSIPHLQEGTRAKAARYLDGFFADIADDQSVERKLLRTCVN